MDAGKGQRIVAILALVVCFSLTASANTVRVYGSDFNLRIPASPSDTNGLMDDAIIEITDHFSITDLDVGISLTHTKVFDLQLFLQSPTGRRLCLNMYNFTEYFNGENYTQTIFDDEAETPIEQGQPPFTGRFRPEPGSLLSVFDGLDTCGSWRLQIYDARYSDTGTLDHFELIIEIPEPLTVLLLAIGTPLMRLRSLRRPIRHNKKSAQLFDINPRL
jgi:subtilisin-like proprotein convertase family protein/predicted small secreted protein